MSLGRLAKEEAAPYMQPLASILSFKQISGTILIYSQE